MKLFKWHISNCISSVLALIFLLTYTTFVKAGGVIVDKQTIRFNGNPCNSQIQFYENINITFSANDYEYGSNSIMERAYVIFSLEPSNKHIKPYYYVVSVERYGEQVEYSRFNFSFTIPAPSNLGRYYLTYKRMKYRNSHRTIGMNDLNTDITKNKLSQSELKGIVTGHFEFLCSISIAKNNEKPELYLRVNNQIPYNFDIKGGLNSEPLVLNCSLKKNSDCIDVYYSYKLEPENDDWSPWQKEDQIPFYYIEKGPHRVSVKCRYKKNGVIDYTSEAYYSFNLTKSFFSEPNKNSIFKNNIYTEYIDKSGTIQQAENPNQIISNIYDSSYALLIGIPNNTNNQFSNLPYINEDLSNMSTALRSSGFNTNILQNPNQQNIMSSIRELINKANRNDRIIIYITSHGFVDDMTKQPFLVCSDCNQNPVTNCLSISEIRNLIENTKDKYKHILLILDSCFSGLGIIEKGNISAIATIASKKGGHILTAGLGEQEAKMDIQLKRSIFTYYFVEGLTSKKADYTNDGIISLSEILIYTQFNVAKHTDGKQTPMLGRVTGSGEMIFD